MDPVTGAALLGLGSNIIGGIAGNSSANRQARAAERAAELEYQAAQAAIAENRAQFQQTREDLGPYRGAGTQTLGSLLAGLQGGEFDAPGFDYKQAAPFQFDPAGNSKARVMIEQANRALNASAAARGGLLSGGLLKGLQKNAMDITSGVESEMYGRYRDEDQQNYGRAADQYNRGYGARQDKANRLQGVAGMGLGAATRTGEFGAQSAGEIGRLGMSGAASLGEGLTQGAAYRGAGTGALFSGLSGALGSGLEAWASRGTGGSGVMRNSVMGRALNQPNYLSGVR